MNIKKNLPLYIALAIPVIMIVVVAAFIYLPGAGKAPQYNFLYADGPGYSVQYGALVPPIHPDVLVQGQAPTPDPQLYIYDVKTNSAQQISYTQAESLKLDPSQSSPDNYTVEQGNGGGGFPFGGSDDYNTWYLKGYNRAIKLNIQLSSSAPYYGQMQFLGWIEGD